MFILSISCSSLMLHHNFEETIMNVSNEILLEELEAVKYYIEVTNDKIAHDVTRDKIIAILNERIHELEEDVDSTISAQKFGADMMMDVA